MKEMLHEMRLLMLAGSKVSVETMMKMLRGVGLPQSCLVCLSMVRAHSSSDSFLIHPAPHTQLSDPSSMSHDQLHHHHLHHLLQSLITMLYKVHRFSDNLFNVLSDIQVFCM